MKRAGKRSAEEEIDPESLKYQNITLSNPKLAKMTEHFKPYAPYSLLK